MAIQRLISIASPSLCTEPPRVPNALRSQSTRLVEECVDLWKSRNGFYALLSALHVFPAGEASGEIDVETWNSPGLWRDEYGDLADGCFFFAEDIFGVQFCLHEDAIHSFDPETGERKRIAASLEEWAQRILDDHKLLCGTPIAQKWQELHSSLPPGKRLFPKTPFVTGGTYGVENLYAGDAIEGMRFRGHFATQIRDLPDGAQIKLTVASPNEQDAKEEA